MSEAALMSFPLSAGSGGPTVSAPTRAPDLTYTSTGGKSNISGSDRDDPVVIEITVTFPNPMTNGVIFEQGADGRGCYFGVRDSGTNLRWRAGNGSFLPNNDTASVTVSASSYAGQTVTFLLTADPSNGTVEIFADGTSIGSDTAADGQMQKGEWAGGDNGAIGEANRIPDGEPNDDFTGTFTFPVKLWFNETL